MVSTLLSNNLLPGYTSRRVPTLGTEIKRVAVHDPTGTYVGTIVYVRRRLPAGGSEYGWRPALNSRARLTTKLEAVQRLPLVAKETAA